MEIPQRLHVVGGSRENCNGKSKWLKNVGFENTATMQLGMTVSEHETSTNVREKREKSVSERQREREKKRVRERESERESE